MANCIIACIILISFVAKCQSYKILLIPYMGEYNSRMMNMLKMADILQEDGHQVSVLLQSRESHRLINPKIKLEEIKIPDDMKLTSIQTFSKEKLKVDFYSDMKLDTLVKFVVGLELPFCETALKDNMHLKLKTDAYDLVIIDTISVCLKIIVDYMDTNVLQYSNYGFTADSSLFYPYIPSITCAQELGPICTTLRPTFAQRLKNILSVNGLNHFIKYPRDNIYQELRMKYNVNTSLSIHDFNKKTLILANVDYVLDPPRPTMPHVIPISGLFVEKPKPLPDHLKQFVSSSDKHGVIIVSFGSTFPIDTLLDIDMFIGFLSKLPQKVILKYSGQALHETSSNILTLPWIPQNDLLAHPATRLFITHCGISSMYEAAIHGVPVVAIPYNVDQPGNADKLVNRRKMGLMLNLNELTPGNLEQTIKTVLSDPTYKENAKATQTLINDRMVEPKEEFLYWVKYVISTKGAKHLINDIAHDMSLIEFWSIDVYLFLLVVLLLICIVAFTFLMCICKTIKRLCAKKMKRE